MTTHRQAAAPSRSTNSLTLSWGLISIPLSVYTGSEKAGSGVVRREFTADGHEVGRQSYDKQTGAPITDTSGVVKKAQASDGTWVELTDDEIAVATGGVVKGLAEIICFVPLEAVGSEYVVEASNQVRPTQRKVGKEKRPDPAAEKAFGLLTSAMRTKGVAALVKVALRGPAKFMAVTPDGEMHTLAFAETLRQPMEMSQASHSDAELALGLQLIDSVGVDTPVLTDDATPKVKAYIEAKAAGQAPQAVEVEAAPVVDLAAALAASLAATAKPAPKKTKKVA